MTTAPTAKRVAAVVYNPIKVDLETLKASVARAEEEAGWGESLWYETSEKDPGDGVTKQALNEGVDVVMAAGGDGTIRAVAESLRDSGVPIALLPAGTGNLLARNLNLALDHMDDSVITAFTGVERSIDLGLVEVRRQSGRRDRHAFLVMAGIGLDARMIANTRPELKARFGWIAYVDAIVRSLRGNNNLRIRYRLDGGPTEGLRINTILIGNCGSLPANILLLPEASVDDGIFDIVALRPKGLGGWIQIWVKIVWENGVLRRSSVGRKLMSLTKEVRTLRYMKGKKLSIILESPQQFQLDGDAFGEAVMLEAWVDPLALKVKIPNDEADALPASDTAKANV